MAQGDDTETGTTDWGLTKAYLQSDPTKWNSLSWITARSLVDSVNDILGRGTQGLVENLRAHWTKNDEDLTIRRPGVSRFLVIGDTGEQDPSQYVVAPALARAAAERVDRHGRVEQRQAGFVLVLSDVIYPSGNVNDYVDGFYKPYRANRVQGLRAPVDVRDRFALPESVPIYAIPGNHDWYDGLYGFAHQFLYAANEPPTWPSDLLAPSFDDTLGPRRLIRDRFGRSMWRTPSEPAGTTAPARWGEPADEGRPAQEARLQPGPYFVIETEHVDLVCIDTGIDGMIDGPQFDWLSSLRGEIPKILMTGKPLLVNGERHKRDVSGRPGKTVYDVVAETKRRYVATLGGDTHNFQLYDPQSEGSSRDGLWHFVSGGGGAYTHATHPIRTAAADARADLRFRPTKLFPRSAESLSYFAQQLVPSIWRLLLTVVLFGAGVALGPWLAGAGGVAIAAMMVLMLLHQLPQRPGRSRFVRRLLVCLEALVIGVLASLFLHQYLPDASGALLALYGSCTLWICLNAWCMRWSRWWSPVETVSRWHHVAFGCVLAALVVLALVPWALAGRGSDDGRTVPWLLVVAVGIYAIVGIVGWRRRIVTTVNGARAASWLERSVAWAVLAQAAVVFGEMLRVLSGEGRTLLFFSGLLGLVPLAVIAVVVLAALLAPDLLTRHLRDDPVRRAQAWLSWRRWMVQPLVFLAAPVTLVLWAWAAGALDSDWMRAAFALPTLITVTAIGLLVIDWVRREHELLYAPLMIVAVLALGGFLLGAAEPGLLDVLGFEDPGRLADDLRTWWPAVAVGGALFTVVAVGAAVLLAHLVFVGAYLLIADPKAWVSPRYRPGGPTPFDFISEADATSIIEAEQEEMGGEPAVVEGVDRRTRRRAQIAFPGLNPPFGPIQRFVSEIYSLDEPPFFKHFLEFETSPTEVVVNIHRVRGDQPVEIEEVARISLTDMAPHVTDRSQPRETRTSDM
ncbi:Calcineurin-like phosphoesterase [Nocardioides sp. YR527]|uniref:metallophosphoesterase n=1 Tax=Nocardioides sp. YR527 TaxID=1881028 RepID=UPI00088B980A|nr:metallophosphoesterase [Nocardioides sp. YR527]SDK48979.1 Calcineurin-like phosphoesterase [Nocardioides sp. YR527]